MNKIKILICFLRRKHVWRYKSHIEEMGEYTKFTFICKICKTTTDGYIFNKDLKKI